MVLSPRQLQQKNAEQTKSLIDEMRYVTWGMMHPSNRRNESFTFHSVERLFRPIPSRSNQMNQELIDLERITLGPAATVGIDEQTRAFSYFDTNGDGVVSPQ